MLLVSTAEIFVNIKEVWLEFYPVVVGGLVTIAGLVAGGLVIWAQVKPILDKLNSLKNSVEDKAGSVSPLEMIKASALMTDLKSKMDNPTISDSLKLEYQSQLFELDKLLATTNSIVDKAEETTNKF
jgi:hypothetical protein